MSISNPFSRTHLPTWLTLPQLAERWNISLPRLKKLRDLGLVRTTQVGGKACVLAVQYQTPSAEVLIAMSKILREERAAERGETPPNECTPYGTYYSPQTVCNLMGEKHEGWSDGVLNEFIAANAFDVHRNASGEKCVLWDSYCKWYNRGGGQKLINARIAELKKLGVDRYWEKQAALEAEAEEDAEDAEQSA